VLTAVANELGKNINFILVEDGVEILQTIYKLYKKGININCIISDENMNIMNGSQCAKILKTIFMPNMNIHFPLYLLTADDNLKLKTKDTSFVDKIYLKPLVKSKAIDMLSNL
jgi:hypothetical protein